MPKHRVPKSQIKKSLLNKMTLTSIEESFSSGKKVHNHPTLNPLSISLIAGLSTIAIFILISGSVYGLYGLLFGSESRIAIIGTDSPILDSAELQQSPSGNTVSVNNPGADTSNGTGTPVTEDRSESPTTVSGQVPGNGSNDESSGETYCQAGSTVPDGVCKAILSIKLDKTLSNSHLSSTVVQQIELLPAEFDLKLLYNTWDPDNNGAGAIEVEVRAGSLGDFRVSGELSIINNEYVITNIAILEVL
ncbi:MAG: hypothetical protein ACI9T8_000357 [Candidatus Saccharimonadales bacterium]|jgi:hypothetical protein